MISRGLVVPSVRNKAFAARSFSILGPTWWNELPNTNLGITNCRTIQKNY